MLNHSASKPYMALRYGYGSNAEKALLPRVELVQLCPPPWSFCANRGCYVHKVPFSETCPPAPQRARKWPRTLGLHFNA